MSEAPGGKLAWGQGANYDAADDRAVITAVTAGRIGLVRPVYVRVGAGLSIIIEGVNSRTTVISGFCCKVSSMP